MADAIVYVDGFNLYYGSLKRTPYEWLDLGRLCAGMLPNDRVIGHQVLHGSHQRTARQSRRTE